MRVVDKVPPETAWLNNKHQQLFSIPKVQFTSANLINPGMCYVTVITISIDKYRLEGTAFIDTYFSLQENNSCIAYIFLIMCV